MERPLRDEASRGGQAMGRSWQGVGIFLLVAATLTALTGCPKATLPTANPAGSPPTAAVEPASAGGGAAGDRALGSATPAAFGSRPGAAEGWPGRLQTGAEAAGGVGAQGLTGAVFPALPSPKEFVEVSALRDIHFDFDRYEVRAQDAKVLDENAQWLKRNAGVRVLIEGHADERGTNEYNLALGERRARAARDYLESRGVDASRMVIISYGEERPVCTERTEACWAKNRRAHFLIKEEANR